MGHVHIKASVKGAQGEQELDGILVDTGASYTVLPTELMERVRAIKTPYIVDLELGDGRTVKASVYVASIRVEDREGPAIIAAFSEAKQVLGVQTLEALGLKVDPLSGGLEPTRPKGLAYFYSLCRWN